MGQRDSSKLSEKPTSDRRRREEAAVEQQDDRQGQAGDLGTRGWLWIDEAVLLIQRLRMSRLFSSIVAVFFAAITFSIQASALVDQGSGFSNSGVEGEADTEAAAAEAAKVRPEAGAAVAGAVLAEMSTSYVQLHALLYRLHRTSKCCVGFMLPPSARDST